MAKRSYGTGSLYVSRDARGRESWYGRWRVDGRRVNRKIGLKRAEGTREGLTRRQAERELQRAIDAELRLAADARLTVEEAGTLLVDHLESLGRKRSTVEEYRSYLRVHLAPFEDAVRQPQVVEDALCDRPSRRLAAMNASTRAGVILSSAASPKRRSSPAASADRRPRSMSTPRRSHTSV